MSAEQRPCTVSYRRLAAALARNFNITYSVITRISDRSSDDRTYYENSKLIFKASSESVLWLFILEQTALDEVAVMHAFKRTDSGLVYAKVIGVEPTKTAPEITHVTTFVEPLLAPATSQYLVNMYTEASQEVQARESRRGVFCLSETVSFVERPEDQNNIMLFFKTENTTFNNRHYKILLMRIRNEAEQRDDLVVAVFHAELQRADSMASPVFKDFMRYYHKRSYSAALRLLEEPGNAWVHLYNVYPYPDEPHCFCWTTPKTKAPEEADYKFDYDERFQPFEIYKVQDVQRNENGYIETADVVAHDGTVVRHRPQHFVTIPGKNEHVRID